MIFTIITLLILSILLNGFLFYGCLNATKKIAVYDQFGEMVVNKLAQVITDMRTIDIRGSFEADDEVGDIFKQMLLLVESLYTFLPEETFNEKEG
jgi:hypothetical protein